MSFDKLGNGNSVYVLSSNPVHSEVYSIQHYVIQIVSDFRQVDGFFRHGTGICSKLEQMKYAYLRWEHDIWADFWFVRFYIWAEILCSKEWNLPILPLFYLYFSSHLESGEITRSTYIKSMGFKFAARIDL
jgi:hypothetical protein